MTTHNRMCMRSLVRVARAWASSSLALILALALAGCARQDGGRAASTAGPSQPTAELSQAPAGTVPLSEIAIHPAAYNGKTVSVHGTITTKVGDRAFVLNDRAANTPILVVMAEQDANIPVGEAVVLTGEVQMFDLAEVERVSGVDLQDDLFAEYTGQPAIIAQSLNLAIPSAGIPEPGSSAGSTASAGTPVTVEAIGENPKEYYGKLVTVQASIAQIVGLNTFTLEDPAVLGIHDLLVVTPRQGVPAGKGEQVRVTGAVRQFDLAAIERGTGLDLPDDRLSNYDGRAAIIATLIEPMR